MELHFAEIPIKELRPGEMFEFQSRDYVLVVEDSKYRGICKDTEYSRDFKPDEVVYCDRPPSKLVEGRVCGTCSLWGRKFATSSRTGYLIPNAKCACNAEIDIPPTLPLSVQKVATFYNDGIDCPAWKDHGEKVEVMSPE